jgi:hypothetical protein
MLPRAQIAAGLTVERDGKRVPKYTRPALPAPFLRLVVHQSARRWRP